MTRKAVTHRRTHHPWWPGEAGVTLERRHEMGMSWGVAGWPAPRTTPEPHPQPWLAILAIQSFQASGALPGQGQGVRGWLAPRDLLWASQPWEQVPGEKVQPVALPRSTMILVVIPSAPKCGMGGLTWMPGGPGGPGGPGIPVGPRMPSLPCKSHRRSWEQLGLGTPWPYPRAASLRDEWDHPQLSPSRPRAPVVRLVQPSLGTQGAPEEKRGVE